MSQQPPVPPGDDDLDELAKFNSSGASSTFLERRWFRWLAIAAAALIVISLTLPVLIPILSAGGDDSASSGAPDSGAPGAPIAPDFVLPAADGSTVRLHEVAAENEAVVLVFYRGFF